jgi:arginine/ornithine N-succinyltransferase beta subunit
VESTKGATHDEVVITYAAAKRLGVGVGDFVRYVEA